MHLDLVFPPAHDPAMPHSALPLLKAYVERNSSHTVTCHDANQRFFADVLHTPSGGQLAAHRETYAQANDVVPAVLAALRFDAWMKGAFARFGTRHDGYGLTMRGLRTPYDRRDPQSVRAFATAAHTPFDALYEELLAQTGPVVGINLSVEDQILPAFRLAHLIRQIQGENSCIIWGGSLLTRLRPVIASELGEFWDHLVTREGEAPLLSLLQWLQDEAPVPASEDRILSKPTPAPERAGIVNPYTSRQVTPIEHTGKADFSDYPVHDYFSLTPMLPALASRKCYWGKCAFCTIHESWDPQARQRSAQSVADDITDLCTTFGIRHFRFVDEAMPPDLLDALLPLIEPEHIAFEIYAIAERRFTDTGFVARLGRSGCRQAYFGLESADEGALVALGKKINQHRHYGRIFQSCAAAGIHVYTYTLFGFPGSSDLAEQRTVDYLINEPAIHTATISSFVAVTGSPFALDNAERLTHNLRMTEDFESVTIGLHGQDLALKANSAAAAAVDAVYAARPDLALSAILNDEMRFSLSDRFGSAFAAAAVSSGHLDIDAITREGDETMKHERIARSLDV
ncbi:MULTISPECIES: B12-binding domain-containing radical SAM protein [unclassified Streptomyces]|uniref:B12-binding domain-containing radical SAM protein n=1 Tax=unclassified Streptomyces TaxID=2593676 RepID=UPI003805844A